MVSVASRISFCCCSCTTQRMNGGGPDHYEVKDVSEYKANYEKLKELGRGKFGIVYEVRPLTEETDKSCAAKYVRARKRDVREGALQEIRLLHKLNHPYIIEFIDAFQGPSEVILVTEFLSGGELFERVADEDFDLTESECVSFMKQICEGVRYLHENQVVHLDLKPENIICVRKDANEVKIIDFGQARELKDSVQIKVMCGTPEFVPPEVVNYDPIGLSSDLWSLGVIAYVLLSGLSPFMGDSQTDTFSNISRAEYDFEEPEFDSITQEAKDFIALLLIKTPGKRMSAEKCLEHPWLTTSEKLEMKKKINTAKLRKFLARRRWQRCGQAIRAMKRMSGLMLKRRSTQSMDSNIAEHSLDEEKEIKTHKTGSSEDSNSDEEVAHFVYSRVYTTTFTMTVT
ncbi:myosin light chain kinase, smooth muscle-like isoform X1 [Tigriopus californicus]|uniref:myosin light chain kinase, smooth muscle-like isoform X1 n=2 Tax=Tigriopus californicus TaxID=6832 RepID=UPI0027D9E27C|nr:myosin light chain kinase, smooth muscle-like isoform X1 [Tigriopus californicus]